MLGDYVRETFISLSLLKIGTSNPLEKPACYRD